MRVFVTGATGFIGKHVTRALVGAGHRVIGLTRSRDGANALAALGAEAHAGSLEDLASLRGGAGASDAVIHLAFNNDFSRFAEVCEIDRVAIETLGEALVGSGKPLIVPNGIAGLSPNGRVVTEDDAIPEHYPFPRLSEQTALRLASEGVAATVVRLAQVHDTTKLGLVSRLLAVAQEKGVSAYVGEGATRLAAVHVSDAAQLFRLAVERPQAGARLHAAAEEGVAVRVIADTIGRCLGIASSSMSREEAGKHFGPLSMFISQPMAISAVATKKALRWNPVGPSLIADLEAASAP